MRAPLACSAAGYPEESYHTSSYGPLHNDAGAVIGMLCVVGEDTDRVATVRDPASDPSVVRTEQEMLALVAHALGANPRDLPFTLTYLFDEDTGAARLMGASGIAVGHPPAPALRRRDEPAIWPTDRGRGIRCGTV